MEDNLVSRQIGSVYSRIERYVLQNLDSPTHGRGTRLQYQQRPLETLSKYGCGKKVVWPFGIRLKSGCSKCFIVNHTFEEINHAFEEINHTWRSWAGTLISIGTSGSFAFPPMALIGKSHLR